VHFSKDRDLVTIPEAGGDVNVPKSVGLWGGSKPSGQVMTQMKFSEISHLSGPTQPYPPALWGEIWTSDVGKPGGMPLFIPFGPSKDWTQITVQRLT